MADFIRARSAEQKEQRLEEIKGAARSQFQTHPYHEITLTTIADELGWSRANLYKYVTTKEEIFLLLAGDECASYFEALLAALPEGCGLAPDVVAEVWAGIANAHQEYFRLGDLLTTIIETNVTVERLARFKSGYYAHVSPMEERLPRILHIRAESWSWKKCHRAFWLAWAPGCQSQSWAKVGRSISSTPGRSPRKPQPHTLPIWASGWCSFSRD